MSYDYNSGWGYITDTAEQRLEELYHKIAPYTHRKRKFEVLTDLPDKIYQRLILEMDERELSIYNEIEAGVANEFLEHPTRNPLTIMLRLRQYTASLKVKHIIELVENILETGEKVVIVDYFKDSLYQLKEKLGDVAALHTGDQGDEERAEVVKKFQDPNSNLKVFLGSIQTCGYGLTLTAASKLFIISLPYSVGDYDQVADRCHRIGQKDVVNIYPAIFPDTIDDYVYSSIEGKRKEIVKVMDNEDYKSNVGESILSEVIQKIKEKHKK
jgi:SNF2 family DNA or RNA helicase